MQHHPHGGAALSQLANERERFQGSARVHGAERLVGEQHALLRTAAELRQGAGQSSPLLLSDAEFVEAVGRPIGESDAAEGILDWGGVILPSGAPNVSSSNTPSATRPGSSACFASASSTASRAFW